MVLMVGETEPREFSLEELMPIQNEAYMLAPEKATHVVISEYGHVYYANKDKDTDDGDWSDTVYRWPHDYRTGHQFTWPQCPDHLKGKIHELPRREEE
jgi:hypothetical protein